MKTDIVNDFLIYVIEEYKYLEKKPAKDIIDIFTKNDVFHYILEHYDILHTMGGQAIIDDINCLIHNRSQRQEVL